jgi:hypothetical protein
LLASSTGACAAAAKIIIPIIVLTLSCRLMVNGIGKERVNQRPFGAARDAVHRHPGRLLLKLDRCGRS